MNFRTFLSNCAIPLLVAGAALTPAAALDRTSFAMDILVDGRPLTEYAARGTTYVEALEGREYSVRLSNRSGGRIAVALAVDGLNSIDAKTTAMQQASKWILGPHETIQVDGWQTGPETSRRFFFTTESRSYGAWLEETSNLGVISAAVFRERLPSSPVWRRDRPRRNSRKSAPGRGPSAPLPEGARSHADQQALGESSADAAPGAAPNDDFAATGIGREQTHRVRRIRFDAEPNPATLLQLRYEFHETLAALGVLPQPRGSWRERLRQRERSRGFEDLPRDGFAPDPFR